MNRHEASDPVTITLTAREWDAVRNVGYTDTDHYRLCKVIEEYTGSADTRRAVALTKAQTTVPELTKKVKSRLKRLVGELVILREQDGPIGDHLGRGDGWPKGQDGWSVCCIRATDSNAGGWPNMHFQRKAVWFDHRELPIPEAEIKQLVKMVAKHREVVDEWHSGSWVSVTWKPRR